MLTRLQHYEEVEEYLLGALDWYRQYPPNENFNGLSRLDTFDRLIELYDAWDKPDQASLWRETLSAFEREWVVPPRQRSLQ